MSQQNTYYSTKILFICGWLVMRNYWHIVLVCCLTVLFSSCKKDFYSTSARDTLHYSNDTVSFDTLFTQTGSITQSFTIKNDQKGIIKIDKVFLENGDASEFIINVNGTQGPSVSNIEIASGDSIFVFIQTKLKEQEVDTILYHQEQLVVEYNSRTDKVIITAWGQDVVNLKGAILNTQTFKANKPYVIYDSLIVNEGETLTIEAGTKLYLHYNANIRIKGSLKIEGTSENPVHITSDRLEETYQLLPGQWGSIIFEATSKDNEISYTKIINGVNGLVFYGDNSHEISCKINNTQISNMSGNGVYAQNAHIDSYNCIFANCDYSVLNIQGGWFNSVHNTIYNIGSAKGRKYYPSVSISDSCENGTIALQQASFYNSIIVGTMTNEIVFNTNGGNNSLPCIMQYCLIRDTYTQNDSAYYKNITYYNDEKNLFSNTATFTLDTLSQAINIGNIEYANIHPTDLLNHSRIADSKPDVGALEYFYEEKKEH